MIQLIQTAWVRGEARALFNPSCEAISEPRSLETAGGLVTPQPPNVPIPPKATLQEKGTVCGGTGSPVQPGCDT